ncbi:hypothetical protein GEMRC1_009136 [Eukaryota sp. GEM-RC1]
MKPLFVLCILIAVAFANIDFNFDDIDDPVPPPPQEILDIIDYSLSFPSLRLFGSMGGAFVRTLRSLPRRAFFDPDAIADGRFVWDPQTAEAGFHPLNDNSTPDFLYLSGVASIAVVPVSLFVFFYLWLVGYIVFYLLKVTTCCFCCGCRCCCSPKKKVKHDASIFWRGLFFSFILLIFFAFICAYSGNMIQHEGVMKVAKSPSSLDSLVEVTASVSKEGVVVAREALDIASQFNVTIWELLPATDRVLDGFNCIAENLLLLPNASFLITEVSKVNLIKENLPDTDALYAEIAKVYDVKADVEGYLSDLRLYVVQTNQALEEITFEKLMELKEVVDDTEVFAVNVRGDVSSLKTVVVSVNDELIKIPDLEGEDGLIDALTKIIDSSNTLTPLLENLAGPDGRLTSSAEFVGDVTALLASDEDTSHVGLVEALGHYSDSIVVITGTSTEKRDHLKDTDTISTEAERTALINHLNSINIGVNDWKDPNEVESDVNTLGGLVDVSNLPDFGAIKDDLIAINDVLDIISPAFIDSITGDLTTMGDVMTELKNLIPSLKSGIQSTNQTLGTAPDLEGLRTRVDDIKTAIDLLPDMPVLAQMVRDLNISLLNLPDFGPESVFRMELAKLDTVFDLMPDFDGIINASRRINHVVDMLDCLADFVLMIQEVDRDIIDLPPMITDILDMLNSTIEHFDGDLLDSLNDTISQIEDLDTEKPDISDILTDLDNIVDSIESLPDLMELADDVEEIGAKVDDLPDLDDVDQKIHDIIDKLNNLPDFDELLKDIDQLHADLNSAPDISAVIADLQSLRTSVDDIDRQLILDAIEELGNLESTTWPSVDTTSDDFDKISDFQTAWSAGYSTCRAHLESCDDTCDGNGFACEAISDAIDGFDQINAQYISDLATDADSALTDLEKFQTLTKLTLTWLRFKIV